MEDNTDPLDALGDPTRRAIIERLRHGPAPVGVIAEGLTVSRPAVSQHLAVLRQAGLVVERPDGTRRIYRLEPATLAGLRSWLDGLYDDALAAAASSTEPVPAGAAADAGGSEPAAEAERKGDGKKKHGKKHGKH